TRQPSDRVPRPRSLGRTLARGRARPARALAARDRAREPQLGDGGDRLHRRTPPLGVPRRAPRRGLPQGLERARAPPRPRARRRPLVNDIPLFPLNTVLFPGGRLPLRIFEQRYMDMAKACLRERTPFGVCLIREGREVGTPAIPADIGTLARIAAWDMPQLGLDSASWVSSRLAELLPLPLQAKQELLELDSARIRIERLSELLRPPTGALGER